MKELDLDLPCDLTESEIQQRAQQLGASIAEYDELESQKKDAMKAFAENLGAIRGRMRLLSKVVRSKQEFRIVHCAIDFNVPTVGIKRTVRLDTGEVVREERMTDEERQQPMFGEVNSKPN